MERITHRHLIFGASNANARREMRFVQAANLVCAGGARERVNAAVFERQRHSIVVEARVQPKRTAARPQSLRNVMEQVIEEGERGH